MQVWKMTASMTKLAGSIALWLMLAGLAPSPSLGAQNLLINGDFASGAGHSPAAWTPQSWVSSPDTRYRWIEPFNDSPGELEIEVTGAGNDARWIQPVHLDPGWYYVHAQAKTERVGSG